MNLRKLCFISLVVLLVCQLGFAQDRNTSLRAITKAQSTGKAVPVVPVSSVIGTQRPRPTVWITGQVFSKMTKPSLTTGEPWFCDYSNGSFNAFCPKGLQTAYQTKQIINANDGAGMVIAIVDLYNYPTAEADLAQFNADMGLPACTTANGCFTSISLSPYDGTGSGWDFEAMLDLEYAHAMAPKAKLVYVQADPSTGPGLAQGVDVGAKGCPASLYCLPSQSSPAADVVSNSWVYTAEVTGYDPYVTQNKVVLAASGDWQAFPLAGFISWPCTNPGVTCIGGTSLFTTPALQRIVETGWAGSGGGCSQAYAMPPWQGNNGSNVCSPNRATPDISAIADPSTPVAIYIGAGGPYGPGYYGVGGTSVATPVLAGLVADIETARVSFGKSKLTYLNTGVYQAATANYNYFYYDVLLGNNGYPAGFQFDRVTGLGVPTGKNLANRFFGLP